MRFVIVHGGYHGSWAWARVIAELGARGHDAVAVDLPGRGERAGVRASLASWRATLRDVIEDGDVLVGHSMGGFVISLAADEVPDKIGRLIFLSAAVPIEGKAMGDATDETVANDWPSVVGMPYEDFVEVIDMPGQGPAVRLTNQDAANTLFYNDCTPEDRQWAWERLAPLPLAPTLEPISVPRFWETPIPRDYITCTDDNTHPVAMDNVFMRRLGLSTGMSIISSHSPFISRPAELAQLFDACAQGALSADPGRE